MAKGIYELAMALKAYEENNGEKESSVNAIMRATDWPYPIASWYYDMFRSDGIRHWKEKTAIWAEHITGEKEGQAGENTLVDAPDAVPLGEGTKNSPYLIGNAAQLDWFRDKVNGGESSIHGALIANITYNEGKDVGSYDGKSPNNFTPFMPIASNSKGYKGTFDGRGNTISGLYINMDGNPGCGLFGYVAKDGVVKDVKIRNSYISTSYSKAPSVRIGGIAGSCSGAVGGCDVEATINARSNFSGIKSTNIYCGGIIGYAGGALMVMVTGCVYSGSIDASGIATDIYCGGITGITGSPATVTDCTCSGNIGVSGTASSGIYCGGLIGGSWTSLTIKDCTCPGNTSVSGKASSGIYCGGIVGYNHGTATACTCSGSVDVSGTATAYIYCGGIVGVDSGTASMSDCTCSGSVDVSGTAVTTINCGGIMGYNGGTASNCIMSGSVDVRGTATNIYCGGTTGITGSASKVTNCTSSGNIGVGSTANTLSICCGGIIGYTYGTATIMGCTCPGSINVRGTAPVINRKNITGNDLGE